MPPINSSVPPGLTVRTALRATQSASNMCSLMAWRACSKSMSSSAHITRSAGRDHHVIDWRRQVPEELLERSRIRGVERRGALRAELAPGALQALGIPAREDHVRALLARASRRFEPDAGATADHDDGLPEQFRFAMAHDQSCSANTCACVFPYG